MKKIIKYSIPDYIIQNLDSSKGPINVQIRILLNANGFKFEDDGKLSSITNLNPKPLGELIVCRDFTSMYIHYKQILS